MTSTLLSSAIASAFLDSNYFHFQVCLRMAHTDSGQNIKTILVVCAFPLNPKEAHAFLLTQTMCTFKADSTEEKDIPPLSLPQLARLLIYIEP